MTSKDVKSSSVLPKSMRRAAPAPLSRSVIVEKDGLETSDTPTPPPTPPSVSDGSITTADLLAVYGSGRCSESSKRKQVQFWKTSAVTASAANTPPVAIGTVAQGATGLYYTRLGAQICWKHLCVRGRIDWTGTNVSGVAAQLQALMNPPCVRIVIFWDKMPLLVGTDVNTEPSCIWAQDVTAGTGMGAMMLTGAITNPTYTNSVANYNYNTHGTRYHILHDQIISGRHLNAEGNSGGSTNVYCSQNSRFEINIDLKGLKQTYSGTASTTAIDNSLKMFIINDDGPAGVIVPTSIWTTQAIFEDLEQ